MSHFTKVHTKITDLECLKQALEDLQYAYREGEVRVRGWRGQWSEADLVVDSSDAPIKTVVDRILASLAAHANGAAT